MEQGAAEPTEKGQDTSHMYVQQPKQKPLNFEFGDLTEKNIGQLQLLNTYVFPVHYSDSFYKSLLRNNPGNEAPCRLAYYNDVLVGAVCCRLEPKEGDPKKFKLYIMTLGVLKAYRSAGLGSKLLQHVLDYCNNKPHIEEIYLHVQTNNKTAIDFYQRFGFKIVETLPGYYKKIEPPDCHVLKKFLRPQPASA